MIFVAAVAVFAVVPGAVCLEAPKSGVVQGNATQRIAKPVLRGAVDAAVMATTGVRHTALMNSTARLAAAPPCKCEAASPTWKKPTRTAPKCIFIDLGAADGNTFLRFLANDYGAVSACPSGQYEAFLVEANPRFNEPLMAEAQKHPGMVHELNSTAAYMCEAETSFFLDTVNTEHNHWGSSMSDSKPSVVRSGQVKVTVPTVNVMKLIYENTIPTDSVVVKMDIEGAEWDILPCLATSSAAPLIDHLYVEEHPPSYSLTGTSPTAFQAAKDALRKQNVDIPPYNTRHTL